MTRRNNERKTRLSKTLDFRFSLRRLRDRAKQTRCRIFDEYPYLNTDVVGNNNGEKLPRPASSYTTKLKPRSICRKSKWRDALARACGPGETANKYIYLLGK